jgi:hypothetical protein
MTTFLLDLIRHGKAHKQSDAESELSAPPQSTQHRTQPRERDLLEPQPPPKEAPKSPPATYQREAEIIVKEERQARNKMPVYKGLERFKLLDKMGEYVLLYSATTPC